MSKLFVFGIGGTGSRIIKSLSFLLASGVDINAEQVVPIIIDPDLANGDLNRTTDILSNYQEIRKELGFDKNEFFKTKITTLNELASSNDGNVNTARPEFRFSLSGIQANKFHDFIDYTNLNVSTKALIDSLYSNQNLNSGMEKGFKGHPNIGSVVLNQFLDSPEFQTFASNFGQDDRIFIASSIFGGTGAAGFPLLLKNLRQVPNQVSNHNFIQNAPIGAVTMLPYFGIEPDEQSMINKDTFYAKAKAALHYYLRNISGNNSLNLLYYLGDERNKDYENHEGAHDQQNDAHFVELAAALSIIDFMDESPLNVNQGTAQNTYFKHFGVEKDSDPVTFTDLGQTTKTKITKPLANYWYFTNYLQERWPDVLDRVNWSRVGNHPVDKDFANTTFFSQYLQNFNTRYRKWIQEMANNVRGFAPFTLRYGSDQLFKRINGYKPKEEFLSLAKNYDKYDEYLNKAYDEVGDRNTPEKFMSLFFTATDQLLTRKINM